MTLGLYRLDGHVAVPIGDDEIAAWSERLITRDRQVARTQVGAMCVSTVFLGLDYGFGNTRRPILFETAVFGPGPVKMEVANRYCTWDEAEAGHAAIVARLRGLS